MDNAVIKEPLQASRIDTAALKKFAQEARRRLRDEIATRLEQVLRTDSVELREKEASIKQLQLELTSTSKEALIDRVAYTWFNRFCALRFMDANRYTRAGTVSPADGFTQPEILAEAKQGHIDESLKPYITEQRVFDLLGGRITSKDPQQEAYRLLIVAVCNYYNATMPFLFEKIADFTELLMPDDLLSDSSLLADMRDTLTVDSCKDVEVIGWLYQFYISQKKDEVFEDLKKSKRITPENIPAATQLFTPHWIVRYLVENSLGRLWLLNKPKSRLIDRMDYYIRPEHEEMDFLRVNNPEDLKICDPACGSGHMLVYAFDLLYAIYEEEGYDTTEIPRLILENNLYGIEIDERAGELSAFALVMKARERHRRFFSKPIQPNICVLENITFNEGELAPYLDVVGHNLFTDNFRKTLHQFQESNNFGSLIRPAAADIATLLDILEKKNVGQNIFLHKTHERVLQLLRFAEYLCPKYHVVLANPPYMGSKGMNGRLSAWLKDNYPEYKSDLFASFVVRCSELALGGGQIGIMSPNVWMFISSHEDLRTFLLGEKLLTNLVELPLTGFKGATVQICAYNFTNSRPSDFPGVFIRLVDFRGADKEMAKFTLQAIADPTCEWLYKASSSDFKNIPGSPIAYWMSDRARTAFVVGVALGRLVTIKQGMATSDNTRFVRAWSEVSKVNIAFNCISLEESETRDERWYPYNKGGDFRKWYGNNDSVVNWQHNGEELKAFQSTLNQGWHVRLKSREYYFKPSITWTKISSGHFGVRYSPAGFIFDTGGSSAFPEEKYIKFYTALLSSKVTAEYLKAVNPTMNFQVENIAVLPVLESKTDVNLQTIDKNASNCIAMTILDWDSYETSWDFSCLPLNTPQYRQPTLEATYNTLRSHWRDMTLEMQRLEEENNLIFIRAYDLQDELSPEVSLSEITLSCNPHYRYASDKGIKELETALLTDTIKEFISYAVGCMFGRYAIDKPGLILGNQGDTKDDYLRQIPKPSFPVDDDNVIPILDSDWFSDDISERFRKFLRITFGDDHYQENLQFIENTLGKDIRKYFLKDFYAEHVKRYKKRPIYWLFSTPKSSFSALIYMHRYRPDNVSIVLNDYLREFRTKLNARKTHLEQIAISTASNQSDKTKALKEIENLKKVLDEIDDYERDVLYPLATKRIEIDLDDGVKVNYQKFGAALKPIAGLDATEE